MNLPTLQDVLLAERKHPKGGPASSRGRAKPKGAHL
jgi:hypothetical protein